MVAFLLPCRDCNQYADPGRNAVGGTSVDFVASKPGEEVGCSA